MREPEFLERDYLPGDEHSIVTLFESVFGRPMGPSESTHHWNWEFRDGPSGPGLIRLALRENQLVSQYAVVPRVLACPMGTFRGALSLDTMTAPGARGHHLFPRLAEAVYARLADQGSKWVFGFPNHQSAPMFYRRLRWSRPCELRVYARILRPSQMEGSALHRGAVLVATSALRAFGDSHDWLATSVRKHDVTETLPSHDELDDFWQRSRNPMTCSVVRDGTYMHWRYPGRPQESYCYLVARDAGTIRGLAVLAVETRRGIQHGAIMECLAGRESGDTGIDLLRMLVVLARDRGVQLLTFLASPSDSSFRRDLRRAGFVGFPPGVLGESLSFGARATGKVPVPSEWSLSWGDTDLL